VVAGGHVEEAALHERFAASHARGEWYVLSGLALPPISPWVSPFVCASCGAPVSKRTTVRARAGGYVARCVGCVRQDPACHPGRKRKPRRSCAECRGELSLYVRGDLCRRCFARTKLWSMGVAARTPAPTA
jgi:hypothetical protein